ncbi:MAG: Rpn family recombination-promoting nuclease/putative transposase [Candidatus Calescibacterium sp.]|nr:Rpn family recombination-promoting nuclease/putative transposase [Candidatus Calescibacterium sp.]
MRYDSEIKKTFEKVAIGVLKILGYEIVEVRPLPIEMQIGKLVADFLAIVKLKDGTEFILHIEFQTKNDPDMPKRMLRYFSVIISRHDLPVLQIVIYLGKEGVRMGNGIDMNFQGTSISYRYQIVDIKTIEAEKFLESDAPDVYLLAILGRTEDISEVIRKIISRLRESFEKREISKHDLLEYINRLGVFGNLRDIREDLRKEVEKTVIDIDITKTWLYQEGLEKGMKEGLEKGIQKGIQKGRKEGIKEGLRRGLKEALLYDIRFKFGKVSLSIKKRIMQIDDIEKLRFLKRLVLKARTLKEFEEKFKSINHR